MVIYRYPLIIFDSDYITNSLDRLDRPETRRIPPFKNSHFARFDSLTHDYFADRDRPTILGAFLCLERSPIGSAKIVISPDRVTIGTETEQNQNLLRLTLFPY